MAIIVNNESNMQGNPTEDAIRQALAGMDLASVQDSLTASRYAVSSVDQANVPTLVGAQIGGNSGTQGGTGQNIIGQDSVVAETQGNLTIIKLVSDQGGGGLPGNTYYYGTGPTGIKGFFTVASTMAVASTSRLSQTVGANGVSTFDLATVADAGGGSLLRLVRDAWGRITGTSTPTTTDLAEGSNLYFTAARVLATVLAGLSTATNAVITAADTVLSALGKLQAQITANDLLAVHLAGTETITGAKTFNAAIIGNDANALYYRKNNLTSNYTLTASDVGTYLGIFAPLTVTIPPNVFSVFGPSGAPIAGVVRFVQNSNASNIVTLSAGAGVLISGPTATTGPNQILEAINIALNGWVTHLYS